MFLKPPFGLQLDLLHVQYVGLVIHSIFPSDAERFTCLSNFQDAFVVISPATLSMSCLVLNESAMHLLFLRYWHS